MMIKESEVLERIGAAIDEMNTDDLANLYNSITNYGVMAEEIELEEGWHLVAKEGAH